MDFPRLRQLKRLPARYPTYNFANTVFVAIQHLMGTNGSLFELLHQMGLPYERMYVLGKVYSTNEAVYDELKHRGIHVHPGSMSLDEPQLKTDYKLVLAKAANEMLARAIARLQPSTTLLIVDDGGVLISLVNGRSLQMGTRIVAVKQTRSGAKTVRTLSDIAFPVINVAESNTKLRDESPYIAASIIEQALERINRLPNCKSLTESHILVVGHCAIGKNVAAQLRPLVRSVDIHDTVAIKGTVVIRSFQQAVKGKDIVFGCVGKAWLPENYSITLPGDIILISCSSSNSEFLGLSIGAEKPIASSVLFQNKDLTRVHSDYSFNGNKGWILNAGFPVNFDGSIDPVAPRTIELTRMLMLSGILQALTTKNMPGLQALTLKF